MVGTWAYRGAIAALVLQMMQLKLVHGTTQCQNGGTFDNVQWRCICTPDFYGENCETAFSNSNPCSDPNIPELNDATGSHGPGNNQPCSATGGCITFSGIPSRWYRLRSPAGGVISTTCPGTTEACGSLSPFIVTNMVREANANRVLYSARLSKVSRSEAVNCYDSSGTYYPVRILDCASYNLYYLGPTMTTSHHYCIGDKKKCSPGLVSSDGSGYEPCFNASACMPQVKSGTVTLPVIQQVRNNLSSRWYESLFNCTIQDSFETNTTGGIRYRAMYRLSYHNGTRKVIDACTSNDLTITPGGSTTVTCKYDKLLLPDSNIYGGTLECIVQAKCNSDTSEYISQELVSISHRFEFIYKLVDPTTFADASVISPSNPVLLCIDIFKVPLQGIVEIRVSTRRQAVIANDKIKIMVNSSIGNNSSSESTDPCSIQFQGMDVRYTKVCTSLVLLNEDEEGLIPYGLDGSMLAPKVEVNVSYRSSNPSGGVYTAGNSVRLQSRELTVNLMQFYATEMKDYLHVYSDPFFKPANAISAYWDSIRGTCRVMSLMRNTILPYEIQAKECSNLHELDGHSGITEVVIRYEYYLIRIYSRDRHFYYQARKLEKSALPLTADNVPRGITIERTNNAVRVKFDIYGTIVYLWGFITNVIPSPGVTTVNECIHNFIQSRASITAGNGCNQQSHFSVSGFDSMDLMIVPGFYDTPSRTEGIMYRPNRQSWKSTDLVEMNSQRDMFSDNFVADRVTESILKPTEWLDFCICTDSTSPVTGSSRCVISKKEIDRTRRSVNKVILPRKSRSSSTDLLPTPGQIGNITAEMATEVCGKYVQAMAGLGKAMTVAECSNSSGILEGADYMTQFRTVCVQYATLLNTFNYTEAIFNSIANRCLMTLSYNVPIVQNRPGILQQMQVELCPSNCSGKGVCISGACQCRSGFTGPDCQTAVSTAPTQVILVNLYSSGALCPSKTCTVTYLSVSPYLKSATPNCLIRSTGSYGYEERMASEPLASNIVGCSMRGVLSFLKYKKMMFVVVSVQLVASDWSSENSANILVYQEACKDGSVVCSSTSMTCSILEANNFGTASDLNSCEEKVGTAGACVPSGAVLLSLLMAFGVLMLLK